MRRKAISALAGFALIAAPGMCAGAEVSDIAVVAREIRQAIAMIDWFYVQHRACPQPSRPAELKEMQAGLGDGYSVEPQGQFVAIRGISMFAGWLYYTSPRHPDRCSLWRKLGWDAALIWRRHGNITEWVLDPGDGGAERPFRLTP